MLKDGTNVDFKIRFQTTPLSVFTSVKDYTPFLNRSNVVYKVSCPGCGCSYIGKTDRTLFERTSEHAWSDQSSIVRQHIQDCEQFNHIFDMLNIDMDYFDSNEVVPENDDNMTQRKEFSKEVIRQNTCILDQDSNWNVLLYKEALHISRSNPILNCGLKASREPVLFR